MVLLEKVKSSLDKTVKYVFELSDKVIMEVTYIDNNTDKDIICVATQTMCSMGCQFCHLTDYIGKLKLRNIKQEEITDSVDYIYNDLNLKKNNRPLLISYMGCGESLMNIEEVETSILALQSKYSNIRFGLSTMLPRKKWDGIFRLANMVNKFEVPLKIHLSLHYTNDEKRLEMMPNSTKIKASIAALEFYNQITGQPVEVHYTLIKDENDTNNDLSNLIELLEGKNIPIKFLRFNEKGSNHNERAEKELIQLFRNTLESYGIKAEYYEPPGIDVGASCGQFLFDQYQKQLEEVKEDKFV
jgi:adenine C2-methylase RlmN of 23S rRNA A2503 and tRNA A37